MQEKQTTINVKAGMNAAHHQRGVLPSTIPAMESESHPRLRLFATSGMRSSSTGVCGMTGTSLISCSAISELLSQPDRVQHFHYGWNRARAWYDPPALSHTRRCSTASRNNPACGDWD